MAHEKALFAQRAVVVVVVSDQNRQEQMVEAVVVEAEEEEEAFSDKLGESITNPTRPVIAEVDEAGGWWIGMVCSVIKDRQ